MGRDDLYESEESDYDRLLKKFRERVEKVAKRLENFPLSSFLAKEFYYLDILFGSQALDTQSLREEFVKQLEDFADMVEKRGGAR